MQASVESIIKNSVITNNCNRFYTTFYSWLNTSSLPAKKKNYLLRVNSWSAKTANIQLIAEEGEKQEKLISCKESTVIVQIPEKNDVIHS